MKVGALRSAALWLSVAPLLFAGAAVASEPTYDFDLRSDSLKGALEQFARQSGLQVAYFTRVAEGRGAPAVNGRLTADQALGTLLHASGLTFERIDDGVVAIRAHQTGAADEPVGRQEPPASEPSTRAEPSAARDDVVQMSEVLVTGSHIRGVVNDTAPITTYDQSYIQRSGYSNMMQLVESLPMNFKGGASGSTEVAEFGGAANYGQNLSRGTGFNLRGLGSQSTLTLINGRRVAPSAQGQFVDVSTIPMTAVERIEILTDGASAIYGADAVAGVVNIILRNDFDGAELSLQYGSADDGSTQDGRVAMAWGSSWQGGNAMLVGEYYRRSPLDALDRDFIVKAGFEGPTWLLPRREAVSLMFSAQQQLPGGFDVAADMLYSYEEVDSLSTSGGGAVAFTQAPTTNRWSAVFNLGYEPFENSDWRFALEGNIGRTVTKTNMLYTDVATGNRLLWIRDYSDRFDTWMIDAKADGTVLELPGGEVKLAVGVGYREEAVLSTRVRQVPNTGFEVRADDDRQVTYAFAEMYVPIVGRHQDLAWADRIGLSLAYRHDDYSDFGSTSNPKVGLVWSPTESLDLRASYSTSFRAPTVAEKAIGVRGQQISTGSVAAADGSGALVPMFYLMGSAPLGPEESDNIAVGFTWRPQAIGGLELSMNWFEIDYTNRITSPPFDMGALMRRSDFGDLITDIASDAAAEAYLAQRIAAGDLYIDWEGTGFTGVRYLFDLRQKNAARVQTRGYDVSARYHFTTRVDSFDLQFNATHLREILTSLTRDSTTFDQIDTFAQPLDWRFRAIGSWMRGGFGMTLALNYADDYMNTVRVVDEVIKAWTTVDLNLMYDFGAQPRTGFLQGTRVSLGIANLLDENPPWVDLTGAATVSPIGFDPFNADAMGRYITLRFSKSW